MRIEDISEKNYEDVFSICSNNRVFAPMDDPILDKGREIKRNWILEVLEKYGSCTKIAYLDNTPVAQILFYPEEIIPFNHQPRKDVIHLQCIFNPYTKAQRKGVGDALMKSLIEDCHKGIGCLGGRPCSFIVTKTFPHEGDLPLDMFYSKYGFKHGNQEMYLEVTKEYVPREILENRRLPDDYGKAINFYNPTCEWGYFYAVKVKELLNEMEPNLSVRILSLWEQPEEYIIRSHKQQIAARTFINTEEPNPFLFWIDKNAFRREAEKALKSNLFAEART